MSRPEPGDSFNAVDRTSGQDVSVRILPAGSLDDSLQKEFFTRIEPVVRMNGKHLEKVLDAGLTDDGTPYVVSERIKGSRLSEIITAEAPLSVLRAVDLCRQIARGLSEAARTGTVHGRLSPRLIVVSSGKRGKGAEKVRITGYAPWDLPESPVAFDFEMIAPEVILGATPDLRSDCYALGVMMYAMLTGRSPFTAATREALTLAHLNDRIDVPSSIRGDGEIPPALDNLVRRLLEKNPDRRLGDPEQILVQLENINSNEQESGVFADAGQPTAESGTAAQMPAETESELDEGISFASGRRIKTTDFKAMKVTELMGAMAAGPAEPTAPIGLLDPVSVKQKTPEPAASDKVPAVAATPVRNSRSSPIAAIAVGGFFVLAAVAVVGWFVLQYQTRKLEIEAARTVPAAQAVQVVPAAQAAAEPVQTAGAHQAAAQPTEPAQEKASDTAEVPARPEPAAATPPTQQQIATTPSAGDTGDARPVPVAASEDANPEPSGQKTVTVKTKESVKKPARPATATRKTDPASRPATAASNDETVQKRKTGKASAANEGSKPSSAASSIDWDDEDDSKPAAKPAAKPAKGRAPAGSESGPALNWDE